MVLYGTILYNIAYPQKYHLVARHTRTHSHPSVSPEPDRLIDLSFRPFVITMQKKKSKKATPSKDAPSSKGAAVASPASVATVSANNDTTAGNQPRNLLLMDAATVPLTYEFDISNRRNHVSITVRQQDNDETWPGGAIWDLGIVLASLCVALANGGGGGASATSACTLTLQGGRPKKYPIQIPERLVQKQKDDAWFRRFWTAPKSTGLRWVELGCGVGLTGLVAGGALRPRAMLLTDLDGVVEQVTRPNTLANQALYKGFTHCRALPLCWGNENDLARVRQILEETYKAPTPTRLSPRKKRSPSAASTDAENYNEDRVRSCADVVIIGDCAYQHKPGAPSHFDVLHETLMQILHNDTLVIFGTRIRMPASVDLLEMFRQDLEEVISPPISADEIDPASFGSVKHNMTIHFMRRKERAESGSKPLATNQ